MDRASIAPAKRRRHCRAVAGQHGAGAGRPDLHCQGGPSPGLRNRLLRLAAFQNPEFYKAQAMRLPTYDKPRIIACAEDYPKHIGAAARLPGGCAGAAVRSQDHGRSFETNGTTGSRWTSTFHGELRPEQQAAAEAMLAHDTGVLSATTAFGKTVLAAWLIAQRGVNTLVLVHRRQLLEQWVERLGDVS